MDQVLNYLEGLPDFLIYFVGGVAVTKLYLLTYIAITPHREITLIKENNMAASLAFCGAMLGFVIPVASAISNAVSIIDALLWAVVAAIVQIGSYFLVRVFYPRISQRIVDGEVAAALNLAIVQISAGVLQAASMTYWPEV